MRIAIALDASDESTDAFDVAAEADRAGVAAVAIPALAGGEAAFAAAIAAVTRDVRILVPVVLGSDNPTTLAEELSVVDHISGGRVVAVVTNGGLDEDAAAEDRSVLEAAWSGRWVDLPARWRIGDPVRVAVTPAPAQLVLPIWDTIVAADSEKGRLATADAVRLTISGDLERDRGEIVRLAATGVGLAIVTIPRGLAVERFVARYLIPEAAMPGFPRIVAESAWPSAGPIPEHPPVL
ncbi:LLM class flavin-dependent oxidoreductase [Microbacterium sp. 18062]|uniref:LLM class flavin-dependent oxidoreductase n=1 Tax=Microbacterium sp. 18062 TaxID=2681410 RepID=UPI00135AABFB|nr:LLM class flavin-dependent oxidoreductase [Microbacterium sp. 18062]